MRLPYIKPQSGIKRLITSFEGLDLRENAPACSFAGMENITSENGLPQTTAFGAGISCPAKAENLVGADKLYFVADNCLTDGNVSLPLPLASGTKRTLKVLGAKIFVFPDKVYVNTAESPIKLYKMENIFKGAAKIAVYKIPWDFDFTKHSHKGAIGKNPDKSAPQACNYSTIGDIIICTDTTPTTLYECTAQNEYYTVTRWTEINNYLLALFAYDASGNSLPIEGFEPGDAVSITGTAFDGSCYVEKNITRGTEKGIALNVRLDYDSVGMRHNLTDIVYFDTPSLEISRLVPDMDFVTVKNGRLYGASSKNHEIYVSAADRPCVFNDFSGASYGSFALSVPSGGDFTAAFTYKNYALFFKKDGVYKLYGDKPSDFYLSRTDLCGPETNESLSDINGILFYKAENGIYAYNGAYAYKISAALGNKRYTGGFAGTQNGKYYLCTSDENGKACVLVYDTSAKTFSSRSANGYKAAASLLGKLYFCDGSYVYIADEATENVSFSLCTSCLAESENENMHYTKISLRMCLGANSEVTLYTVLKRGGEKKEIMTIKSRAEKIVTLPIVPQRSDFLMLYISGFGSFKLMSLERCAQRGSECYGGI